MDSFVSRKRRRESPVPPAVANLIEPEPAQDDDSTELKLAVLASLHPYVEQNLLLDILLANEGSVEAASVALSNPDSASSPRKKSAGLGHQSSISTFAVSASSPSTPARPEINRRAKTPTKKGRTLHLYSPEDIAAHTPCSIVHNFLAADDANALLEELLGEATTFERSTFKLFDNVVQSPHSACFYVQSLEEERTQRTEYLYNGSYLTHIRQLTPHMRRLSPLVEDAVNSAIHTRIHTHYANQRKLQHQSPHRWTPNAAFVNCYDGGAESVGYHSDQLTYLGPRAVIGSLSLGVAREFRVRRVGPDGDGDAAGQIAIHLPHNSLLVMHAEMQEGWKHSIAPAAAIDPHPLAGRRRINVTYRHYRASFHPKLTPRCTCRVPAVLRCVQRKKENVGRYFWMCHAGNTPDKEGCTFFLWAEFDDDGEPKRPGDGRTGERDGQDREAEDEREMNLAECDGDKGPVRQGSIVDEAS